jgi:hypothetical protein
MSRIETLNSNYELLLEAIRNSNQELYLDDESKLVYAESAVEHNDEIVVNAWFDGKRNGRETRQHRCVTIQ